MSDHFRLTEAQIERLKPYFPHSHGVPRVDDRRVLNGINHALKRGLQWRDASIAYSFTAFNADLRMSNRRSNQNNAVQCICDFDVRSMAA